MKKTITKGFSIIEVMITLGLIGGIALGLTKILNQAQKGQKGVQNNIDFDNLRNSIALIVRNQSLCSVALKNLAGNQAAKFSSTANPAESIGSIFLGNTLLAQEGSAMAGGLMISKIELIDTGVAPVVTSTRKTYIAKLIVEATRSNSVGAKEITNRGNPVLLAVTVDASTDQIVTCNGGSNMVSLDYPSSCKINFSHQDNGGIIRTINLSLTMPGHVGIRLTGDVNNDDRLYIQGTCDPNAGPLDKYLSSCILGIGFRDVTDNANPINDSPTNFATTFVNAPASHFQFTGNVNKDDSFYFLMSCPTTSDPELQEAQDYIRSNCYFCFGYSDYYRPQMDTRVCSPVQEQGIAKWSRFRMIGDVNGDDILFPGFYCKNDAGATVKSIKWD